MTAVEVITSVERRRRWSRDEKLRIVAESSRPGRTASQVAREHGIAPGQLFIWRRQLLAEAIAHGVGSDGFVPVEIANEHSAAALPGSPGARVWLAAGFHRHAQGL
jgi:transposase